MVDSILVIYFRILATRQNMFTQRVTNTHTCARTHTHTNTHSHIHTHSHAHTYTHAHTQRGTWAIVLAKGEIWNALHICLKTDRLFQDVDISSLRRSVGRRALVCNHRSVFYAKIIDEWAKGGYTNYALHSLHTEICPTNNMNASSWQFAADRCLGQDE